MRTPWTKGHDEQLLRLHRNGTPKNEIARALNRANSSIRSRLLTLGEIDSDGDVCVCSTEPDGDRLKTTRNCLCCRAEFQSAGPHNRLCGRCRSKDFSPYAY